ncbi:MAG: transporter substrate-binding domain-containing protein [Alphaproteobacteria bacterium]|nr:transporter substrate-binding domain-containing protein [Alphaproteobacteria bacterium]
MIKIFTTFNLIPFIVSTCFAINCVTPEKEKLKLCSTADWPPYEFTDPATKKVVGSSVNIIKKIADKLNLDLETSSLPWERCLQMNQQGEIDGIFSVSKTPDREQYLIYPQNNIQNVSYVFATIRGSNIAWDESKNVSAIPQPIGAPQGYSVTKTLKEMKNIKVDDSAQSDEINLNKLLLGRVGSIILGPQALDLLLKEKKVSDKIQQLNPPFVDSKKYYIAISKKYKNDENKANELVQRIDAAIKDEPCP